MPTNILGNDDAITALRAALQAAGRSAFARGMVWGTSGNISGKLPDGQLLLSKAATDLADLADDDFALAAPGFDDQVPPEATSEIRMHRAAHAASDDVRCVLHLSPVWVTLAATTGLDVPITTTAEAHLMLAGLARPVGLPRHGGPRARRRGGVGGWRPRPHPRRARRADPRQVAARSAAADGDAGVHRPSRHPRPSERRTPYPPHPRPACPDRPQIQGALTAKARRTRRREEKRSNPCFSSLLRVLRAFVVQIPHPVPWRERM